MRAPDFWWRDRPSCLARILTPVGTLWGAVAARRMTGQGAAAPVPVVCVGNLVAGGAGKTPAALEIARLLTLSGRRPVFLSRGYGGRIAGPIQVDLERHGFQDVGDEPLLLARAAPCVVAHDRAAGAALAAGLGDVIVMDDGFQNPGLVKDLPILVVDAATGAGNGLCIPAGPLRAPLAAQLACAEAVVLIGEGGADWTRLDKPTFRARVVPDDSAAPLRGRRVLAFAGIGRPQKFADTLRALGADVVEFRSFPDHHVFTERDASGLLAAARQENLSLVTTEKDRVRLSGPGLEELAVRTETVAIGLEFEDPEAAAALLTSLFA